MKIGIVGLGVVGSAINTGFEKLGHEIFCHDLKLNSTIKDIIPIRPFWPQLRQNHRI